MKKLIALLLVGFAWGVTLAQNQPVNKTGISNRDMQERVQKNVNAGIEAAKTTETDKAIEILNQTQDVISLIAQKKKDEAQKKLANIIGKLEILLAQNPDLAVIPVSATTEVHDVVTDPKTVDDIMKAVREAIDKGYYQTAKWALNDLSSEIVVKTAYLPMATYPDAMKLAAKLMGQDKTKEAAAVLVQALNTLVIRQEVIPLPVLRAEEYVKEALKVMDNDKKFKENKTQLLALIDAADYQLTLAEKMGYGKKDKEYKDLHDVIKSLKSHIEKEREKRTRKVLNKLSDELKAFKERLFTKTNKK